MSFSAEPKLGHSGLLESTSGMALGGMWLELRQKFTAGRVVESELALQHSTQPFFYVLFRAWHPDGKGFCSEELWVNQKIYKTYRNGSVLYSLETDGNYLEDPGLMPLHLQVEDGAGGWRDLVGPIMPDNQDGRAIAVIDAIPRRKPELRLRALRAGSPDIELVVPNPGYKKEIKNPELRKSPVFHDLGRSQIVCEEPIWLDAKFPSQSLLRIETRIKPIHLPEHFYSTRVEYSDSTGNCLILRSNHNQKPGILPLPNEDYVKINAYITRRMGYYPWEEHEVVFLAEGIFAEVDRCQITSFLPEGQKFGCRSVTFKEVENSDRAGNSAHDHDRTFDITLEVECSNSQMDEMQQHYEWQHLIVFTDSSHAAGIVSDVASSMKRGVQNSHGVVTCQWRGQVKKGERIRIAMIPKNLPEVVEFTLRVPEKPIGSDQPEHRLSR
ncbi:MAG: hypothetical protein LDL31_06160 [Prosthecobacter sp.]|nr:hypothetical protein [Prosthecobacter sp.]